MPRVSGNSHAGKATIESYPFTDEPHLLWRYGDRRPNGKREKQPLQPNGTPASVTNPQTWCSFPDACTALETGGFDGIGLIFHGTLTGIDLDDCLDENGTLSAEAEAILHRFPKAYVERSPSQRGLHLIVRGTLPPGRRKRGDIEAYDDKRFFTITFDVLPGTQFQDVDCAETLACFHQEYLVDPLDPPPTHAAPTVKTQASPNHTDAQVLTLARTHNKRFHSLFEDGETSAYPSSSEADLALCNILAHYSGNEAQVDTLFRQSALLRPKWDEKRGPSTYGALTVRKAVSSSVPARLADLTQRTLARIDLFRGTAGTTDLAVLQAAYAIAARKGRFFISLDHRTAADEAGRTRRTLTRAFHRLCHNGWLKKHSRRSRDASAYTLVEYPPLLTNPDHSKRCNCDTIRTQQKTVGTYGDVIAPFAHDAFRTGGLAKSGALILAAVERGPLPTLKAIAEATGRSERTVKTRVKQLLAYRLLVKTADGYALGPTTLDGVAQQLGTVGLAEAQRATHREERREFYRPKRPLRVVSTQPKPAAPVDIQPQWEPWTEARGEGVRYAASFRGYARRTRARLQL